MYLKKIEVQGFKSFANKIVFEFHNGVTAIVGPNGSGKSNVSDAVRWVLGEQSARQLRGGNMQDVIFAGTELRKPLGYAYVALTMDNSDHRLPIEYDEVVVSRRLFRSGESEYMLNGASCRLRDIQELFYDTGVGRDGYSVIGQGQIDQILSGKPEDRRELFDEAAGITKFKRRKLLTQKKLDSEHANMLRITDILAELEKQVGPLKKQSEDAREYLRLREEQRKYDANYYLRQSDILEDQISETEKSRNVLTEDYESAQASAEELKSQNEGLIELLEELDKGLEQTRDSIASGNIEIGELTGRINVLNEQIRAENINAEHIRSRLETVQKALDERRRQIAGYRDQERELSASYKASEEAQTQAEEDLVARDEQIMLLEKSIEDNNQAVMAALGERAELLAERQRLAGLTEQLNLRKSETAQKLLKSKSGRLSIEQEYDAASERVKNADRTADELAARHKELEARYGEAVRASSEASARTVSCEGDIRALKAQYESLRNLAERYEGYGGAVRKVMDAGDRGVLGVVADIISSDKKYELAIETALGARLQNVVTDTEDTAKRLISMLKETRAGRVTFLPLDAMKNGRPYDLSSFRKERGFLGSAAELVSCDRRYADLVGQLLGRTLVTETVDDALRLQRKNGYELRIVTVEGEQLAPGGAISGGSFRNNSNLLGRRRELEELEKKIKETEERLVRLKTEEKDAADALAECMSSVETLRKEEQEAYLEKNSARQALSTIEGRLSEYDETAEGLEVELETLEKEAQEISEASEEAERSILAVDGRHDEIEGNGSSSASELAKARGEREELSSLYAARQVETAEKAAQLEFLRENINRVSEELSDLYAEKSELSEASGEGEIAVRERTEEIEAAEKKSEELRTSVEDLKRKEADLQEKKSARSGEQKSYFDRRDALMERISALDKEIFRLQTRLERTQDQLASLNGYIWNEYELTAETVRAYEDESLKETPAQLKKTADAFRTDIRKLGDINPSAIEQYREVSERYELMSSQHADLKAAEESLTKIIEDLDKGMRKQFSEQFALIQKQFAKTFSELFGGGVAGLELDPEADMLDAGIFINAQPPGKKLQNMMQLSGGEKALTAIALLFAIQNLRPSPFALLDEIEAALDESNVDRFAEYLKKLTGSTQFIVITHRRGTMVSADRLYGITMQEKGISTLVSVKLIEDELS